MDSDPPLKSDNHFLATRPLIFWALLEKSIFFPLKIPKHKNFKKLVLEVQNVMHNATNVGHTTQNDGRTMQNDSRTMRNVSRNTLNICQGPKGGLEEPPRAPGDPHTWKNSPSLKKGPTDENVGISYLIVIIKFGFFKVSNPPPPISSESRTSLILSIQGAPSSYPHFL